MAQPTYEWQPSERGWREQDLFDLPENGNRYEIIDGSLHVTLRRTTITTNLPTVSGRLWGPRHRRAGGLFVRSGYSCRRAI